MYSCTGVYPSFPQVSAGVSVPLGPISAVSVSLRQLLSSQVMGGFGRWSDEGGGREASS